MKRSQWWIWSLVAGLVATGVIGWRLVSQRHEVQLHRVGGEIASLDKAIAEDLVPAISPASSQRLAFANRLKNALALPESDSNIHPSNRPVLTFWEGWARMDAGLRGIDEALGDGSVPSDPRPEIYQNNWETIEAALADRNFDVPATIGSEDYNRFREAVAKQLRTPADEDLIRRLGLVFEQRAGEWILSRADESALASIGVTFSETEPPVANPTVLVRGMPVGRQQRDFLGWRLWVQDQVTIAASKVGGRMSQLNRPEIAWQFKRAVTEDITPPDSPITIRSLAGQVLDARRRHIDALADFAASPLDGAKQGELTFERNRYLMAVDRLQRELVAASREVSEVLSPRGDQAVSFYDELRDAVQMRIANIQREVSRLEDQLPEPALDLGVPSPEAETVAQAAARIRAQQEAIRGRRMDRLERASDGLHAINEFPARVLALTREDDKLDMQGRFSTADIDAAFRRAPALRTMIETLESSGPDQLSGFLEGLRAVLLADLSVVRSRIALLMDRGYEAREGLARLTTDMSNLRNAMTKSFPAETLGATRRLGSEDLSGPEGEVIANRIFLEELSTAWQQRSRAQIGPSPSERAIVAQLALEMDAVRRSLLEASFEYAEFAHQHMIFAMQRLTGSSRPAVSFSAADTVRRHWMNWERAVLEFGEGLRPEFPAHPLETINFSVSPEMREVGHYIEMEMEYRRLRDQAIAQYRAFVESDHPRIARRAEYGIAAIMSDDLWYQWDWKWRNGHGPDPRANLQNGAVAINYGIFSYMEGLPGRVARVSGATDHVAAGHWLGYTDTVEAYRRGPGLDRVRDLEERLERLRQYTAGTDADLFVATRTLLGRLTELKASPRNMQNLGASTYFLGDLPRAVQEFYIPLYQGPNGADNQSVADNHFVPLAGEFQRMQEKLQHMMDSVDGSDPQSLTALFEALAPLSDGRVPNEDQISEFWGQYFAGVAQRAPGLIQLQDTLHEFNYRLANLAQRRAMLLLDGARTDSQEAKRQAVVATERARNLYRRAGKVLFDYNARFPGTEGEARRNFRIGDAYFKSGDYVFAIEAYRAYFKARLEDDQNLERAEPFYVVNRIGEAYMHLGILNGPTMAAAQASGDAMAVARESAVESMTIDAAIPAFQWNIERTRRLMLDTGEGGAPRTTLPPTGALDSFINMAKALVNDGRNKVAIGDPEGVEQFNRAIELLRSNLIESRLFPRPVIGFNDSLFWREAQFQIGLAELELARSERLNPAAERDFARLSGHLRRSGQAFDDIIMRWDQPQNRTLYMRAIESGKSFDEALQEVGGGSERFSDDIYYLTLLNRAEVDWIRAVHFPDPQSNEVARALEGARARLSVLVGALDAIHGRDAPVEGTTFAFPELSLKARFMLGDVIYLQSRTERDRIGGGAGDRFEATRLYQEAIAAYQNARALHPRTHQAVWAYAQEMNCRRALSAWLPAERAEAQRMLDAASAYLRSLPDEAFANAPADMRRQAFEEFFRWYDVQAQATGA